MNIWLELPIKNATKLFFASHRLSHIKVCRQCSHWVQILTSIRLNNYIHFIFLLFKKQRQMKRASEVPFQRFALKQIMRSLKTVLKSCGKNSSLQAWTPCCMKMKMSSRYELELSGLSLTQTSFSVEHELLSGPFCFQWCYGIQCLLLGGQFRCLIVVLWCCLGQLGHSMSFKCWARRAQVLCPMEPASLACFGCLRASLIPWDTCLGNWMVS